MPLKSRFLLASLFLLLTALLAVWFTPFAVSHGVRWWIWWRARQEGFTVNIDKIDAPFLRPVAIHQLRLRNAHDDTLRVDLTITDAMFDLNFKHILLHTRGRAIQNLSIRELHGELHRSNPTVRAVTRRGLATLHRMLPENLTVTNKEVRIETGPTLVLLRNGFLSANQTEAGRFSAAEVMIASPWFHQTFSQVRGATHWEADHLTIAGLTLTHGLDLQSATADLSRLGNQRVGLQFDADAFGGKIRGNISHEWRSQYSNWKIAGGATDISLEQTSEAFGFGDRISGLLHAGNFTFRGNISASIDQLGDFAALFGANAGDFAGKITIDGAMDTRDRKFGGHLMVEGTSITFFKTAIDNLSAKLNLKTTDLEIEQLAMTRKNDSLSGQGKIDLSHEHNYSGTLEARLNNLLEYLSVPRGAPEKGNPIPADVQATIDSSKWDVRAVTHMPNSTPISFTANFPLRIGTDWNAFQLSPLNMTLNFPSIFLAKAPQLFHPEIFRDGILSGNIALSETLQHPHIGGDIQLVNGKLSGDGRGSINLTEASGRIVFGGNRASIEFLNVAAKDTELSLRGEIDFQDTSNVTVRINGAMPIFDLTPHQIDCMSKIEFAPAPFTLAPAVAELQFCGALFQPNWTIGLKERTIAESSDIPDSDGITREFPLCFSGNPLERATLLLGLLPRPEAQPTATPRSKKRTTEGQ